MPSTVLDLFANFGLNIYGKVNWGGRVFDNLPGVYIVSLSDSPDNMGNLLEEAPLRLDNINDRLSSSTCRWTLA